MPHTTTLEAFFQRIEDDPRIQPSHISLFALLHHLWLCNNRQNPLLVRRSVLMKKAKIAAPTTYHKCMRELHGGGYITYEPSFHPLTGSRVCLLPPTETTAS